MGTRPSITVSVFDNRATDEKVGLARSISVMPGDTVKAEVYAKYVDENSGNWTGALATLMGQITANTSGVVYTGEAYSSSTSSFPFPNVQTTNDNETPPKAYLNWLVFDRNYNFIAAKSGYQQLTTAAKEAGADVAHELLSSPNIAITEPGYVYVYLSNEETTPIEVYFDDFTVTHTKSPVVQSDDYYPFGLSISGLSYQRENSTPQDYKYIGKELQDELGLELYDLGARYYDPAIGKFLSIDALSEKYLANSPYHYSMNNPILFKDPTGMTTELFDDNGNKISEDENGNDGKVSVIQDEEQAKRLAENFKQGTLATQQDVDSGIKTTKTVLTEAIAVLDRTSGNGGLREESSIVTGSNEVVRGATGPEPSYATENGQLVQTAQTTRPDLPAGASGADATLIHSHPTKVAENNGQAFPQSANLPTPADRTSFASFGTNIIVGRLGTLTSVSRDSNGNLKDTRPTGAVIYNSNGTTVGQLRRAAMQKIIK